MASQPDTTPPTAGNSGQAPWGWLHSNAGGNSPNSGGTVFEKDQYYFHPDHLGSSSYVTDIDGEIFQHLEYFPFGETWVEESSNTQRTPYLFTGKELDEATGLYYFGARYYDPRTSLWQSPDPILAAYMTGQGSGGGVYRPANLNLFGYVQQRPITAVDPSGEETYDVSVSAALVWGPGIRGGITLAYDTDNHEFEVSVVGGERVGAKGAAEVSFGASPSTYDGNNISDSVEGVISVSAEAKFGSATFGGGVAAKGGLYASWDSKLKWDGDIVPSGNFGPASADADGRREIAFGGGGGVVAGYDATLKATISFPDMYNAVSDYFGSSDGVSLAPNPFQDRSPMPLEYPRQFQDQAIIDYLNGNSNFNE